MAKNAEIKKLCKALKEAKASQHQIKMAAILLAYGGLNVALEFVEHAAAQNKAAR